MKQLTLLLALTLCSIVNAQCRGDFDRNTAIGLLVSPGSWDDGMSVGVQLEHQNCLIYVGPEVYLFPELNATKSTPPMGYTHLIGRFGFNKHFGQVSHTWRLFAGGRGGAIFRENEGAHVLLGLEAGFDIMLGDSLYFRFCGTRDFKTDSTIWSNSPSHTVDSVLGGFGFRF